MSFDHDEYASIAAKIVQGIARDYPDVRTHAQLQARIERELRFIAGDYGAASTPELANMLRRIHQSNSDTIDRH